MKKRNLHLAWLLILNLSTWTAPWAWAVPLSLNQNVQAILAKPVEIGKGFDFVVIGDSRDGAEVYAKLLTRVGNLHPLFIIHTGDFVKSGDPVEYQNYIKQIAAVDIPLYDEMDIGGTQYIITAGGGAKLYNKYNFGKPECGYRLKPSG